MVASKLFVASVVLALKPCRSHNMNLPINPELGVPGWPNCVRARPWLKNLSVEDAAEDLICSQKSAADTAVKIACVGDSITAVGHTSSGAHTYPSQLQSLLDADYGEGAYRVTNLGACGATMQKEADSPYWKRQQYQGLISAKWDIVILMLGTNDARDVIGGNPHNWQPDRPTCDEATVDTLDQCPFATDYAAMLRLLKTLGTTAAGPKVYMMIPPPLMEQGAYNMNQSVINDDYPKLVPLIYKANGNLTDGLIDLYTAFGGVPDWREKFPSKCVINSTWEPCKWYCDEQSCNPGQCHPNDVGCLYLAQVVKKALALPAPPVVI